MGQRQQERKGQICDKDGQCRHHAGTTNWSGVGVGNKEAGKRRSPGKGPWGEGAGGFC